MEDQWANADNVLQNKFLKNSFYSFTNDFLYPSNIEIYEKKTLDITTARYSEQILPILWPFVISRFHCS